MQASRLQEHLCGSHMLPDTNRPCACLRLQIIKSPVLAQTSWGNACFALTAVTNETLNHCRGSQMMAKRSHILSTMATIKETGSLTTSDCMPCPGMAQCNTLRVVGSKAIPSHLLQLPPHILTACHVLQPKTIITKTTIDWTQLRLAVTRAHLHEHFHHRAISCFLLKIYFARLALHACTKEHSRP